MYGRTTAVPHPLSAQRGVGIDSPAVTPAISIVIPIHNEEDFLEAALVRLRGELAQIDADIELILAENGSTDGTGAMAEELTADDASSRVLRLPEPDYGAAMRSGFETAGGEWVVNFDIDYFSAEFLAAGLALEGGADLVLASKRVEGADDRRSALRRAGTRIFNVLLRLLFRSKVSDTHGMKMIRRSVVTEVVPTVRSTRDLFDTELVVRAERAGYRIREVPARVEELRDARSSFLSRVPRTVIGLLRIRRDLWREGRSAG